MLVAGLTMQLRNEATGVSAVPKRKTGDPASTHLVRGRDLAEPGVPVYPEDHVPRGQLGDCKVQSRQGGGEGLDERLPVLEGPPELLVIGFFMSARPLRLARNTYI